MPLHHLGSPNAVCTPKVTKPHPHYVCENVSEYSLEKEMATHSRILAEEIPWTEEPGRLQSIGPQKSQTCLSN